MCFLLFGGIFCGKNIFNHEAKLEQLQKLVQRDLNSGEAPDGFNATVLVNAGAERIDYGHLVIASPPELVWAFILTYANYLDCSPSEEDMARMRRAFLSFPVTFMTAEPGLSSIFCSCLSPFIFIYICVSFFDALRTELPGDIHVRGTTTFVECFIFMLSLLDLFHFHLLLAYVFLFYCYCF